MKHTVDPTVDPAAHDRALDAMKADGYVVLENAVAPDLLAALRSAYETAMASKLARYNIAPRTAYDPRFDRNDGLEKSFRPDGSNYDLNRWVMYLPSALPFLDARLISHPQALALVDALLGADCVLSRLSADVPFPRAGFQTIHQDASELCITVNIPLVDVDEDHSPTEVWPGTHTPQWDAGAAGFDPRAWAPTPGQLRACLASRPSHRVLMRAGSILVRDQRLIHRGTSNRSNEPRPMIVLMYRRPPDSVPHRALSSALSGLGRQLRAVGRGFGRGWVHYGVLNAGATLGFFGENLAGSDRDLRRRIPVDVWNGLDARGRSLLRLATVEGRAPEGYAQLRSMQQTYDLVADTVRDLVRRPR